MKYINQRRYPDIPYVTRQGLNDEEAREYGKHTTAATSACGLCTAIMVVDRLLVDAEFTLAEAIELAYETRANLIAGTDYKIFAPAFAERFGLEVEMTSDPERLRFCLRTGGCGVALSTGDRPDRVGVFTHKAHFVLVINEERDGRLAVLDPSYQEGKYDEEGRKGKVEYKNGIALCEMNVLTEELSTQDPGFYLFWRK